MPKEEGSTGVKFGVNKKRKEEYIDVLKSLDLGLETRLTSKVGLLSGGQRQLYSAYGYT